jgi:Secretion system C-terminal sorting domain
MKKKYLLSMFLLAGFAAFSQIETTTYRGAFAPAPAAMWTNDWANFNPNATVYGATNVDITSDITTNTTWTSANVYKLSGQIFVKNGATLTIEAGTVIRGGDAATKPTLIITRGSKIEAVGTATNPIVFTSGKDVGLRNPGDWGGLIILGRGTYNTNGGYNNIEGLPITADSKFGAQTSLGESLIPNDNSGTLKYVRIEFGGILLSANNEINGLTFGAVGSGTTVDYVQCSFTNDDSFEWFGGSVNCKHLVAYRGVDDDFDTDNGYNGKVQFCLGVKDPNLFDATYNASSNASTSEGFESDNNAAGDISTPLTSALFSNFTMIGPAFRATLPNGGTYPTNSHRRAARIRRNSALNVFNSLFMDFPEGLFLDNSGSAPSGASENNANNNTLKFRFNILAGMGTGRVLIVNTAGNHPSGFVASTWFNNNNNTGLSTPITNSGILTSVYNAADGSVYVGADYRPTTTSIAASGADFTDSAFAGSLSNVDYNTTSYGNSFNVYPNAFTSSFKLSNTSDSTEKVIITVYNINGQIVETRTLSFDDSGTTEFGSSYSSGVYLVNIKQGEVSKTIRAVKN